MTSQKSSISTFSFTFWSALKGNFVLPLLNLVMFTIFVPIMSVVSIKNFSNSTMFYEYPAAGSKDAAAQKVTDLYKYLIFGQSNGEAFNIFLHLSVIAFSVLLGIVMFRFITSKKTVNVIYSLGITRKNLFVSKFLAGALMLAVSITLPFLACVPFNISTFGSSPELWTAVLYYILGYCSLALTAFSVTAAVFSCVGTIIEGIAFSGVVLVGPTIVYYSIQFLMNRLTLGSPYVKYANYYYDSSQAVTSLAGSLAKYNPILFLFKNVTKISSLYRENAEAKFQWSAPDFGAIILWVVVAAAVFALGLVLFQKRKAEICGFLGVNKWLNFLITFLLGFFPFCIAVYNIDSSLVTGVLVGTGIYIAIYLIADFALIRNFREWARGFYKLPIHLGAAFLIFAVFATGLFGYSSRLPSIEKIESADITPPAYTGAVNPLNMSYGGNEFLVSIGQNITGFKSSGDLKTIEEFHKLLIKAGRLKISAFDNSKPANQQVTFAVVKINYHLKNGKTVSRFYDKATMEILNALLAIEDTDRYKELIVRNLTEPAAKTDSQEIANGKKLFQDNSSKVFLIPSRLNVKNEASLTPALRKELLKALAGDLTAQTAKQRYYPEKPALGAIQFVSPDASGEPIIKEMPGQTAVMTMQQISLSGYGMASIIITEDMKNTVLFLETNNLMGNFENSAGSEFVAANVFSAAPSNDYYNFSSLHFMGNWISITDNQGGSFAGTFKVNDKALVKQMADNAHISYFNGGKGYYVLFELSNGGGCTTMYVPASKMPKSVIDAVAAHVITRPQYPDMAY